MNLFLNDFSLEIRKRNPSNLGTTACWFFFNCALTSSWKTSWFYFMLKLLYLFVIGWKGQRFYLLTIELKILLRSFPFCIWVCTLDLSLFHFIICFLFTCLLFVYSRISCCRRFGNLYFLKTIHSIKKDEIWKPLISTSKVLIAYIRIKILYGGWMFTFCACKMSVTNDEEIQQIGSFDIVAYFSICSILVDWVPMRLMYTVVWILLI
jgi:hypothetical protein